jgi:hypothetical protein
VWPELVIFSPPVLDNISGIHGVPLVCRSRKGGSAREYAIYPFINTKIIPLVGYQAITQVIRESIQAAKKAIKKYIASSFVL